MKFSAKREVSTFEAEIAKRKIAKPFPSGLIPVVSDLAATTFVFRRVL